MFHLLAAWPGGLTVTNIAITIIFVAAVIAIVIIALKKYEIQIPPWVIQVAWVLVVAVVCIGAILLLAQLAGWR